MAPPVAQVEEPPAQIAVSDFNVEARRWAIGYTGLSQVPLGFPQAGVDITVPAIGLRYWLNPKLGFDLGFGVRWTGGSTEIGGTSTDKSSVFGFVIQGGLPMALSTHRHVSFQFIPYLVIAHGGTSQGMADFSGTRYDVGARAGFELFFGFIGIPQLALSATVGIQFESRTYHAEVYGTTQNDTTYGLSTTVQESPWDIFGGNVAARYYF
jgi:hypothetical protein